MLNRDNDKILTYIFDDKTYTEEQKAVMISSLSNTIPDDQLINGSLSRDHQRFFIDALSKAGFIFMDKYLEIAKEASNSTQYLFKILQTLSVSQKEKYAMLFLLFMSDCRNRNEDTPNMHKMMELTLGGIGIDKIKLKLIGSKMLTLIL